jgi:hypothetical protein
MIKLKTAEKDMGEIRKGEQYCRFTGKDAEDWQRPQPSWECQRRSSRIRPWTRSSNRNRYAADFLPKGITVEEAARLSRIEFFTKLTEMFAAEMP